MQSSKSRNKGNTVKFTILIGILMKRLNGVRSIVERIVTRAWSPGRVVLFGQSRTLFARCILDKVSLFNSMQCDEMQAAIVELRSSVVNKVHGFQTKTLLAIRLLVLPNWWPQARAVRLPNCQTYSQNLPTRRLSASIILKRTM